MSEMKKCPECNAENPKAANFCRKCRYEFPEATKGGLSLKPEIKIFRIKELQYVVGTKIHIEWDVDNYTRIELSGEDVTLYKDVELVKKLLSCNWSLQMTMIKQNSLSKLHHTHHRLFDAFHHPTQISRLVKQQDYHGVLTMPRQFR